jgi:1-acyl-sn-glycerol-3-phosphate acyltransferase
VTPWLAAAALWLLYAELARRVLMNPRREFASGLYWHFSRLYARGFHRLRARGQEALREREDAGPLIVVMNHTAGVDPVLVQAACAFEIRWVMAQDMRTPALEDWWRYGRVIFVDRQRGGTAGTRDILAHLKAGGVIGIFPEGAIERPARTLLPFQPGVGFIIRRSGALVLPVLIEGTPAGLPTAWASLTRPSRARLSFGEILDYAQTDLTAEQIARDLQARYRAWTGWAVKAP